MLAVTHGWTATPHAVGNWFYRYLGFKGSGPWYGAWSGWGSDIGEVAILGGVIQLYRKHTCHVDGCWRISKHPVEGTAYSTCRKHHPTVPDRVTAEHIKAAHEAARAKV